MKASKRSGADDSVKAIAALPSLGPTSARMLMEAGVFNVAQLRKLGVEKTYRLLRFRFGKRITTNFIYALDAAIRDISWTALEPERKTELREMARNISRELQ